MSLSAVKQRRSILPILLTYFLDNFGYAVIFPIFTPIFLGIEYGLLPPDLSLFKRSLILTLVTSVFPLGQFFGTPIIGEFADRHGRRKAFCITILGTAIGYAITAGGIQLGSISLMLIGRLSSGFFTGNMTICLASMADISSNERLRVKNFSLMGMMGGLSFILAVFGGQTLSHAQGNTLFVISRPFWVLSGIAVVNFIFMWFLYHETHVRHPKGGFHFLQGIHHISSSVKNIKLRKIYPIYFFFMLSWVASMLFLPSLLAHDYGASDTLILWSFVGIGFLWFLSNGLINRFITPDFRLPRGLFLSLFFLSISLFLFTFSQNLLYFFIFLAGMVIAGAFCWTFSISLLSLSASPEVQGKILGINQSLGALATLLSPLIGGFLAKHEIDFIYFFTGLSSLISCLIIKVIGTTYFSKKNS